MDPALESRTQYWSDGSSVGVMDPVLESWTQCWSHGPSVGVMDPVLDSDKVDEEYLWMTNT